MVAIAAGRTPVRGSSSTPSGTPGTINAHGFGPQGAERWWFDPVGYITASEVAVALNFVAGEILSGWPRPKMCPASCSIIAVKS
jgi:hypothetical protein